MREKKMCNICCLLMLVLELNHGQDKSAQLIKYKRKKERKIGIGRRREREREKRKRRDRKERERGIIFAQY